MNKNDLTFSAKEVEILRNERLNYYCISIGALIEYIENEDNEEYMMKTVKSWNFLDENELESFKLKLKRLMP